MLYISGDSELGDILNEKILIRMFYVLIGGKISKIWRGGCSLGFLKLV